MSATGWKSAPTGSVCCYLCHRYLAPEKLENGRCANRTSCSRAAATMPNRPHRPPRSFL